MTHIRKPLPTLVAAAVGVVLLAACGGDAASPESAATEAAATTEEDQTASDDGATDTGFEDVEPIELTFSDAIPDSSTAGAYRNRWMERVTELTEGKVTFDFYGEGTLHPITEGNTAVRDGLTDVTFINHGYWPDDLPISNWGDSVIQADTVELGYPGVNLVGIPATLAWYEEGGPNTEEMAAQGFRSLLPMLSGPEVLSCTEPFSTVDDLAGRQVRVPGEIAQKEHEALGMVGVFLPPTEQYEALQRGVIDCAANAATSVFSHSLLEVTLYHSVTETVPSAGAHYVIATEDWDSLPASVQAAMEQARNEALVPFVQETLDTYKELAEAIEEAGGELVDPRPFDEVIREWRSTQPDVASAAPEGVSDPEGTVQTFEAIVNDWVAFIEDDLGVTMGAPESFDLTLEQYFAGRDVIDDWDAYQQYLDEYTASN